MMFALMTFPILAAMGMAIEYSHITAHRSKLQNAVDAGVLFAGRYLSENDRMPSRRLVKGFIKSNFDQQFKIQKLRRIDDEIHLVVDTNVPAFFFGETFPSVFDQELSATVPIGDRAFLEIVLVLDNTGSMTDRLSDGVTTKMGALKVIATEFVETMLKHSNARNQVRIGLVPFSHYVNIGLDNRYEYWVDAPQGQWRGACVGSLPAPYTLKDIVPVEMVDGVPTTIQFPGIDTYDCTAPLVDLTEYIPDLKVGIAGMSPNASTYIGEGVIWGIRLLSEEEPFTRGKPFGTFSSSVNHRKIMLVLTDGDNTQAPSLPASPKHDSWDGALGNTNTQIACQLARNEGIEIYSVAFGVDISDDGLSVMQDCAGDISRYYHAEDSDELEAVFRQFLEELVMLRLTS